MYFNNVFISSFSLFNSFFHYESSLVLHNFELIGMWKVFQNTFSRSLIS